MQWLKNLWFTHQYYKITEEGDQVSIFETVPYKYILHIEHGKKYHFIKPRESYKIECPYKVIGLSVHFNQTFILPPESFIITGNEFTEPVLKWMCKHYLWTTYVPKATFAVIDEHAVMRQGNSFSVNNTLEKDIKYID